MKNNPPTIRAAILNVALCACFFAGQGQLLPTAEAQTSQDQASKTNSEAAPQRRSNSMATDQEIAWLIEQLGSDSYATRMRARNRLKRFGLEAFDALHKAQNHSDSEILSAARFLVSGLHINWSKETDPDEVQEILHEYGAQDEAERLGRIEMLGNLPDGQGIEPLARLTRFDPSVRLSRHAAMLVLKYQLGDESEDRIALANRLEETLGENDRDGSVWLIALASDLRSGDFDLQRWSDIVQDQRRIVDSGASEAVTSGSVMELIRVIATRAIEEKQIDDAVNLVQQHTDLVPPRTREIDEHCRWAIEKRLYPIVVKLFEDNQHLFKENATLLYTLALSVQQLGDLNRATELADQAFAIDPFPEMPEKDDPENEDPEDENPKPPVVITDHQREELGKRRITVAAILQSRGMFEWAKREFEYIYQNLDIEMPIAVYARHQLAQMYNERLNHQEVLDVLQPVIERMTKDRQYRAMMNASYFRLKEIESLYDYNQGLLALAKMEDATDRESVEKVKANLRQAYRSDSDNIDILIKMYRISDPEDPEWKRQVRQQLTQARTALERDINDLETKVKRRPNRESEAGLAILLNQYAWLVANTEGNYQRAVEASKRSLQLGGQQSNASRSARLDTLARCYYAVGDLSNAIKTQRQALALEPNSPPMQRQLAEFEKAYREVENKK